MATCKGCGSPFQWGFCDGRWVPLEPIETHDDLDRTYVDENGALRADHRDRHPAGASVNVTRLDVKIKADDVLREAMRPRQHDATRPERKRRGGRGRKAA